MSGGVQCADLDAAFRAVPECVITKDGTRFTTHCLYPSFEPVDVFVTPGTPGFMVHDGGGAARAAWRVGRDARIIEQAITRQAVAYQLTIRDQALTAHALAMEWLPSAIIAVANASAIAARTAADTATQALPGVTEATLRDLVWSVLSEMVPAANLAAEFDLRGRSGKRHQFDFAIQERTGALTLIDTVSPHHVSVASRYVAFSDVSGLDGAIHGKFVVHDRPLDPEDVSLLGQFADVVPFGSLKPGLRRVLEHVPFA